jgi:hypothetical protein
MTPAQVRSERNRTTAQASDVLLYTRIRELIRRMEA